jgi:acyl-CoA synthetase (AMP-forming)/AMP-acid ligase II
MQIGTLVSRAARYYGDMPCVSEGDRTLSFREFDEATNRLGNSLIALGLVPGDRVGVLLPNGIECLVAYYALAKSGLVRVVLNSRDTQENSHYKLSDSKSRALIHSGNEAVDLEVDIGPSRLKKLIAEGSKKPCVFDRKLTDLYRLAYTGGTTGRPKGVILTTQGELAEISAFLTDLIPDMNSGDTFLHAAPVAHASGAFILPALIRGAHSVIMPNFDVDLFHELSQQSNASMTFLVPTMLAMMLEASHEQSEALSFRRIIYGASSIAPTLLNRAEERFGRVFAQTYGQAESPMVITCLQPEDHDRIGSCGRAYPLVDCAVVDEGGTFLPAGEIGEIVCSGPQLMAGYWNQPTATECTIVDGWLHTGDMGKMDNDGFFYILDRKNDMLISGGFNVYPREVEDVLVSYDGVVEAAVIGLPDEKWGDRVYAVVTGRPGLDINKLADFAKENLAGYKRPRGLEIWPELPKSSANKILRRTVRDTIIEQQQKAET